MKLSENKIIIFHKIGVILLGVFFLIITLELGLRLGGFLFTSRQEYGNKVSLKQKGTCRIMCLGESTTAGQYPPYLENILNQRNIGIKFSVIDKGCSGIRTRDILLNLENNLYKYKPDMVITMMGCNDSSIAYYKDIPEANTWIFRHCRSYRFIRLIAMHIVTKTQEIRAEQVFKKAVTLNPQDIGAYVELGRVYNAQGKLAEAEQVFKKAVTLNPQDIGLFYPIIFDLCSPEIIHKYWEKEIMRRKSYHITTINNYRKLKQILDRKKIRLVCVQYPVRSIELLKGILGGQEDTIFVDNEKVFKDAIRKEGCKEYFVDLFAGDFGHCTPKGNRLLAENIANVILKEVFGK